MESEHKYKLRQLYRKFKNEITVIATVIALLGILLSGNYYCRQIRMSGIQNKPAISVTDVQFVPQLVTSSFDTSSNIWQMIRPDIFYDQNKYFLLYILRMFDSNQNDLHINAAYTYLDIQKEKKRMNYAGKYYISKSYTLKMFFNNDGNIEATNIDCEISLTSFNDTFINLKNRHQRIRAINRGKTETLGISFPYLANKFIPDSIGLKVTVTYYKNDGNELVKESPFYFKWYKYSRINVLFAESEPF